MQTFQKSSKSFPKAMTLLDATAEANNRNAMYSATEVYKNALSHVLQGDQSYIREAVLTV